MDLQQIWNDVIQSFVESEKDESKKALIISACQSGLFYIPLLLILPHFIGITGIQLALPIAYLLSSLITIPAVYKFFNTL